MAGDDAAGQPFGLQHAQSFEGRAVEAMVGGGIALQAGKGPGDAFFEQGLEAAVDQRRLHWQSNMQRTSMISPAGRPVRSANYFLAVRYWAYPAYRSVDS